MKMKKKERKANLKVPLPIQTPTIIFHLIVNDLNV